MNTLGELIRSKMAEHALSFSELARRSGIPRSTVHALASGRVGLRTTSRPATLEGLARGMDVPLAVVKAASAETASIHVVKVTESDAPETVRMIAAVSEQLTPGQQKLLLTMGEAFLAELKERQSKAPARRRKRD